MFNEEIMCIFQLINNVRKGKAKKEDAQEIFDIFMGKYPCGRIKRKKSERKSSLPQLNG